MNKLKFLFLLALIFLASGACDPGYEMKVISCVGCTPGKYKSLGKNPDTCDPCLPGTYAPAYFTADCSICGLGYYTNVPSGATSCTKCPPELTYPPDPPLEEGDCVPCEPGFYNDKSDRAGLSSCNPCQEGYRYARNEAISCSKCPVATYNDESGQASCKDCPAGTYNNQQGVAKCSPCPVGTSSTATGQQYITACKSCGVGHYSKEGSTECSPCEPNTYNDIAEREECLPCEDGTYSLGGAETCDPCHDFCSKCFGGSQKECNECVEGITYLAPFTSSTCDCIKGYFHDETKTTPETFCQPCDIFCTACKGEYNNCSECINSLGVELIGTECLCSVPNYFKYFNESTQKFDCVTCHELCETCEGPLPTQCTECKRKSNVIFVSPSTCSCSGGYYYDEDTKECEQCHMLCTDCEGPTSGDCIICNTEISYPVANIPGLCVTSCESLDSYYQDENICKRNYCNK